MNTRRRRRRRRVGSENPLGASTLTSAASATAAYHPHCRMGGMAHGFIGPPPRLAAKTTMPAASAGGPAEIF